MSSQINFIALPEDEMRIVRYARENCGFELYCRRQSALAIETRLPPVSSHADIRDQGFFCRESDLIHITWIEVNNVRDEWVASLDNASCLELSPSKIGENLIYPGRLYNPSIQMSSSSELPRERVEFTILANRLFGWVKRKFPMYDGFYRISDAARARIESGELQFAHRGT